MRLGLGTAQFGMNYGVSNSRGVVSLLDLKRILNIAHEQNISVLDTAALYGESEKNLGQAIDIKNHFEIITKTITFTKEREISGENAAELKHTFFASLSLLKIKKCRGLLIHHVDDVLKEGGEYLFDELLALKINGFVDCIGVSVYTEKQIDAVLQRYPMIDLIQLPLNVLDQRFITSGHVKELKKRRIEIHARSLFLQGILLMPPEKLPPYFLPISQKIANYFNVIKESGLSPLQAAITFVKSYSEIDKFIVGVTSSVELMEIVNAYHFQSAKEIDFSFAAIKDEQFTNPSYWNLTV